MDGVHGILSTSLERVPYHRVRYTNCRIWGHSRMEEGTLKWGEGVCVGGGGGGLII